MRALELKIPPPVVTLLVGVLMWGLAGLPPALPLPSSVRIPIAVGLAAVGLAFDVVGVWSFRRSRTTVNPLRPENAQALVTGGVYRVTRNPMYVGMAFILAGWAVYLGAMWPLLGLAIFVAYINRFQIAPEERVLRSKFDDYAAYASRVRRWL